MKRVVALISAAALAAFAAWIVTYQYLSARFATELAARQNSWETEREALVSAGRRSPEIRVLTNIVSQPVAAPESSPEDILARLKAIRITASATPGRSGREAAYLFESLAKLGPPALPAIQSCLASGLEVEYSANPVRSRAAQDVKALRDSVLPASLRFGLFEVTAQIGGTAAEKILAETLSSTGRGIEVAYLARTLEEIAPGKYRQVALDAAHELLRHPMNSGSPSALDRNDADHLYGVLRLYGDGSFVSDAQAQLVRAAGQVDRSALAYLDSMLHEQALPIARQLYSDPRISNPAEKEPLARLALNYVGANAGAEEFYQQTINDRSLSGKIRSNLIEDLNENGFADPKNLTDRDLPIIERRIALIEELAPSAMDRVNEAAFKEAYKDLQNMRAKLTQQGQK
jgi:hypothetical protein